MQKYLKKTRGRDAESATRVKRTAHICGVSQRTVRRVIRGDQINEKVMLVYMRFSEGENLLVEAVKKAVPLN
jgi:hypothetical protein